MKKPFSILTVVAALLASPLAADGAKAVSATAKPKPKLGAELKAAAAGRARAKAQGKADAKMRAEGKAQDKARRLAELKRRAKGQEPARAQHSHWVCPMHDGGEGDKPGKCPKCGMDLVEQKP